MERKTGASKYEFFYKTLEEARRLAAALEHAYAQGALKALKEIVLAGNPASDAAQQAVQNALKQRKK